MFNKLLLKRLVILSVTLFALYLFAGWPDSTPLPEKPKNTLRIATLNINYGNRSADELETFIRENDLDIVLIIEYSDGNFFPESLKDRYKTVIAYPAYTRGLALLHKKDIRVEASIKPSLIRTICTFPFVTASLKWKGKRFSLLGLHAPPPVPACGVQTDTVLKAFAGLLDKGVLQKSIGNCNKGEPLVLLGDLNAFPFQPGVGALKEAGLIDAWAENRFGTGLTWKPLSMLIPVARIDYIMHSPEIETKDIYCTNLPGSDHQAVIADIRF